MTQIFPIQTTTEALAKKENAENSEIHCYYRYYVFSFAKFLMRLIQYRQFDEIFESKSVIPKTDENYSARLKRRCSIHMYCNTFELNALGSIKITNFDANAKIPFVKALNLKRNVGKTFVAFKNRNKGRFDENFKSRSSIHELGESDEK